MRTLCPDVIDTRMVYDQVDSPDAAMLWSGPAPLAVDDVADPRWRCLTAAVPGP